ncbi:MAG: hypothetical protein EBV06_02740 [Planctomycetia bacterium]|nr:hypothetical protein [Planctomycetia bacterium]
MFAFMTFAPCLLFAEQSSATWSDKEVLYAVGSVIGTFIMVIVGMIPLLIYYLDNTKRAEENKTTTAKVMEATTDRQQLLSEMQKQLVDVQREAGILRVSETKMNVQTQKQKEFIELLQSKLNNLQQIFDADRRRIERALTKDGQTWNEKVLSTAPEFRPLAEDDRRTPIISVLNLKGGVGKTTVTTNLAAALDGLGYRVLVMDLDLQGSLTSMFLIDDREVTLLDQEKVLYDFLKKAFAGEFPNLLDYTQTILSNSGLVPTNDRLFYAEMNLTIHWLLREANRDVRFLLRKELHLKRITEKYDIILLDCPPVLNVCCVNALGASDYVLSPVMLSRQATIRVPVMLARIKEFRDNVNPTLKFMGLLGNRATRPGLSSEEQNRLSLVRDKCKEIWGEPVYQFRAAIRQSIDIRKAEDQSRPLNKGDDLYPDFVKLAQEIETLLPTYCRRTVTIPAKELSS